MAGRVARQPPGLDLHGVLQHLVIAGALHAPALAAEAEQPPSMPLPLAEPESEIIEPPSIEEVSALYALARIGNILGLRKRIALLEASDTRWQPFANKLKALAQEIKLQEIRAWLGQYLEEEEQ